jgi:hypothetical protein
MTSATPTDYAFFAEMQIGNMYKILNESFKKCMERIIIDIRQTGMFIRDKDPEFTILFDCEFPREHFKKYICEKDRVVAARVEHISKQLRNLKKKDTVTLFIVKGHPDQLGISIKPDGKKPGERHEINYVTIWDPNEHGHYSPIHIPEEGDYNFPVTIDASEFQKIKKLTTSFKKFDVCVQPERFLKFSGGDSMALPSSLSFGELNDASDGSEMYKSQFNSNNFEMIIKLPGLCHKMQFYSPKDPDYPLKIKLAVSQNQSYFGVANIFIKNSAVIQQEAIDRSNSDVPSGVYQTSDAVINVPGRRGRKKKVH